MKDITPEIFLMTVKSMACRTNECCTVGYDFERWLATSGILRLIRSDNIHLMKCPLCSHLTFYDETPSATCACCGYDSLYRFAQESFTLEHFWALQFEDDEFRIGNFFGKNNRLDLELT